MDMRQPGKHKSGAEATDMEHNEEDKNRYTDKEYWESYYRDSPIRVETVKRIVGEYNTYWDKLIASCSRRPETIIEIGAYPGRYLACLADKYLLKPTALDYNSDVSKIEACFRAFGVSEYTLVQEDFLNYRPDRKYDLVLSNGFAEHFTNYDEVLDRHCSYLAPGGAMLIMIPNKRFLRKYYGLLTDRANLRIHNLDIMRLEVFRNFGMRNHLKTEFIGYHGGFNYNTHQELNPVQKGIKRFFRLCFSRLNPWIRKHPNKYLSSTIIAIYSKR